MPETRVARRYAAALFQFALETGQVDAVVGDLERVLELMRGFPELAAAVRRPSVPASVKKRLLDELLADEVQPITLDFLKLLIDKRRYDILPEVPECYKELADSHRGIVSVQVRSAVPLTEEEKERLSEVLARSLRKQVRLKTNVDPSLIGGVMLRIGDRLLDGSVKGQLNLLRQRLIGRMTSA